MDIFQSNFKHFNVSLLKFLIRLFESAYELHVNGPRDIGQTSVSKELSSYPEHYG